MSAIALFLPTLPKRESTATTLGDYVSRPSARAALLALIFGVLLAGCGAPQVDAVVPDNIGEIQITEPGASLAALGYTPVARMVKQTDNSLSGYVYVHCGQTPIPECASDMRNVSTAEYPNLFVSLTGTISIMEGPTRNLNDVRTYMVIPPDQYKEFTALNDDQRRQLLGIMPQAIALFEQLDTEQVNTVKTDIGFVKIWLQ